MKVFICRDNSENRKKILKIVDSPKDIVFGNGEISYAKLKTISDSQFMLWDEANKKVEYSYLSSKHKIDAVDPTVKLSALNNDKVGDWHKTVTFSSTPSETLNKTCSGRSFTTLSAFRLRQECFIRCGR